MGNQALFRRPVTAVFLVLAGLAASVVDAQPVAEPANLFAVVEPVALARLTTGPDTTPVVRQRLVRLDQDLLSTARSNVGRADAPPAVLRLNLFDDIALDAAVEGTGPTSGGYWLSGRIEGWAPGSMTLAVNAEVVAGTVRAPSGTYAIRSVGNGVHAIRQVDPAALLLRESDFLRPPASHASLPGLQPLRTLEPEGAAADVEALPAEDGSRIDVLVIYTPAARDAEGGLEQIEGLIDLYVAETNQAYAHSGVIQRLNLVLASMVDYEQAGPGLSGEGHPLAGAADLNRLARPNDGHMDEVHDLRDRYAADIVTLVGDYTDETGGIAYWGCGRENRGCLPPPWAAFNLVNRRVSSITFAHEHGHTMGLNHDRYAATRCPRCDEPPEQDLAKWKPYPYSFGYVNQRAFEPDAPEASRWGTIMAYSSQCEDAGIRCVRVLRFSNPDQTYSRAPDTPGDPMGVPGDEPSSSVTGPADNRRTLNETRRIVANFRRAPCLGEQGPVDVRLQASNGRFVTAIGKSGGYVRADRDVPGPWERLQLAGAAAGCIESGDEVFLSTADDFYLRAAGGGGSTLEATGTAAGPWESFRMRRQSGAGPVRSGNLVTLQAASGHYVVAEQGGGGGLRADHTVAAPWATFKIVLAESDAADGADLVVQSPAVGDDTPSPYQLLTLSAAVRNRGSATADGTRIRYFRSGDPEISTSDTEVGSSDVASLEAGGVDFSSIAFNAPAVPATHYYGACVDGVSAESNFLNNCSSSAAVTVIRGGAFTDDHIRPGTTQVKAVHIRELRARIAALRMREGLSVVSWTDTNLRIAVTPVKRIHLTELRAALDEAYDAAGLSRPRYTDAVVRAGATAIKAAHIMELRAAVVDLERN